MTFIYDLDNENGGTILSDSDTAGPALTVNSNAVGYPAIAIYSTASASPLHVKALKIASRFESAEIAPALEVNSYAAGYNALQIYSTASGSPLHIKSTHVSPKFESLLAATKPALEVNSYAPGYNALQIASTASGYPIDLTAINATYGARFRSTATGGVAVIVGKTVTGSPTIAPLKIQHPSCASAAVMEFGGGFISCTSIDIITAANADYVIPVSLNGVVRYIPLMGAAAIQGGAAF